MNKYFWKKNQNNRRHREADRLSFKRISESSLAWYIGFTEIVTPLEMSRVERCSGKIAIFFDDNIDARLNHFEQRIFRSEYYHIQTSCTIIFLDSFDSFTMLMVSRGRAHLICVCVRALFLLLLLLFSSVCRLFFAMKLLFLSTQRECERNERNRSRNGNFQ